MNELIGNKFKLIKADGQVCIFTITKVTELEDVTYLTCEDKKGINLHLRPQELKLFLTNGIYQAI